LVVEKRFLHHPAETAATVREFPREVDQRAAIVLVDPVYDGGGSNVGLGTQNRVPPGLAADYTGYAAPEFSPGRPLPDSNLCGLHDIEEVLRGCLSGALRASFTYLSAGCRVRIE
jgi:hypothetical protein